MITQNSNNKPSGSTAVQCDAGIPIMGRTADTGVYQIIKVNPDGSIASPAAYIPNTTDLALPVANPLNPVGVFAAGIILYYNPSNVGFVADVQTAGVYVIRPFFMFQYTVLGAVNFALIQNGTPLDAYVSGRAIGTDSFAPSITDVSQGLAYFWHNVANQQVGGTVAKSVFANNQQFEVFLEVGVYKLLVTSHTALTTGSATTYVGFEVFYKK
jgi:hypothetical protein